MNIDRETGYRDDPRDKTGHEHPCELCGKQFECDGQDCGKPVAVSPGVCGECETHQLIDTASKLDFARLLSEEPNISQVFSRAVKRELDRQSGCDDWLEQQRTIEALADALESCLTALGKYGSPPDWRLSCIPKAKAALKLAGRRP